MQDYDLFMDVSGDIMPEMVKVNNLHLIPMEFIVDSDSFMYDYFDTDFDIVKFYDDMKKKVNIKTSQITPYKYEEYFERYGEGPQITLTIEQDDDHVRMEYAGYGVLADGTKEEVHDVLDFSATWPWIALGQMPTLEHS